MVAAIIVAAGRGRRLGGIKKQFLHLKGKTVLQRSIEAFSPVDDVTEIVVVVPPEDIEWVKEQSYPKITEVVAGGNTREESVQLGMKAVSDKAKYIAVHDAARPLISPEDINRVIMDAKRCGAALLGLPLKDTVKKVENGYVLSTLPRETLFTVQTPQVFSRELFEKAINQKIENQTDDSQWIEALGERVYITLGSERNIKITTEQDLQLAEFLLSNERETK